MPLVPRKKDLNVNILEILAVIKAFKAFEPLIQGKVVQIAIENCRAMFYLSKEAHIRYLSCSSLSCCENQVFKGIIYLILV